MATRYSSSDTHRRELMGIPPTGNRVTIAGIAVDLISGGKIEESWDNSDALGIMQQLGVIPTPEQASA